MWQHAVNIVLGIWIIGVSLYVLQSIGHTLGWMLIIPGVLIVAVAFWGLAEELDLYSHTRKDNGM